jgi:Uma2 family endonuclease
MSAAILPVSPASDSLRRKRFTRREVERMLELSIFDGARCELIDGELIDNMGQNPPHAQAIRNLFAWLVRLFSPERLQMQLPIEVGAGDAEWNAPEPDLAVLGDAGADYGKRHPRGSELSLLVEVSDSSLRQDLIVKRDLYTRAAVKEYWVLDLQGRRLIVHRDPVQGAYRQIEILAEDGLASCGRQTCAVRDLLPQTQLGATQIGLT